MKPDLVIRNSEWGDIAIVDGVIDAIGPRLVHGAADELDARGGAVIPGLHDHHLHLLALAAAQHSVECGPPAVRSADALTSALRDAPGTGWVRGVGYHESVAGPLDRWRLDAVVSNRPVRIQHRSGAMWFLNSLALTTSALEAVAPDGRLRRNDHSIRAIDDSMPDVASLGLRLAAFGVTGVTDATPDLGDRALEHLLAADLPQQLLLLGAPSSSALAGPRKLVLDEAAGLDLDKTVNVVATCHADGRAVAVHCVTRAEVVVAVEAIASAAPRRGDRLEHASILPAELIDRIATLGIAVVTQPGFIAERGDAYRTDVEARDLDHLYRCRSLLAAGVPVALSTDAPFTDADPWRAMRAAVERRTEEGAVLGPDERLLPHEALDLFLAPLDAPGSSPRRIQPGSPADLCVLGAPIAEALAHLDSSVVTTTIIAGRLAWSSEP